MFCQKCGKELADTMKFCDSCGASTSAQGNATPPPAPQVNYTQPNYTQGATGTAENKIIYMLAYLGILFFLPLVVTPVTDKGKFHANQGLLLFLTGIVGDIAISIVGGIFNVITYRLFFIGSTLSFLFGIAILALLIIGMVNAYNDKQQPLPVIGKLFTIIK